MLAVLAIVSYATHGLLAVRPRSWHFIDFDREARFYVWYCPFGKAWKGYLKPENHAMMPIYRRQLWWTCFYVLILMCVAFWPSENGWPLF